jgi:hypothetical protein
MNQTVCFKNFSMILGLEEELLELPHWKTINDYLEKLPPEELDALIPKLVYRLTRMGSFVNSRIRNKYWQVLVDGTGLYTFDERHCPHCLTREFKDEKGNVIRTEYYHAVLEAKLVVNGNVVVSIATEFVENENPFVTKQDCELKAFYRLSEKLKGRFPRLPICLCMDSLYACAPVFELCRNFKWSYIIRFKDGSISSVAKDFHALKNMESSQSWDLPDGEITKSYKYVTGIPYKDFLLNMVEYTQSDLKYPFVFVTNLTITKRNCEQLVLDGRRRWKIENEGFNAQKNHGLGLEHTFSKNYTAMKNHYYLIQIGHMIAQFFEIGLRRWTALKKETSNKLFADLKEAFRTVLLTDTDVAFVKKRVQYRL